MEKEFEELKELVKNMNKEGLEKVIKKIDEIEHKATSCKNSLAYLKAENRWYRDAFKKIKVIAERF